VLNTASGVAGCLLLILENRIEHRRQQLVSCFAQVIVVHVHRLKIPATKTTLRITKISGWVKNGNTTLSGSGILSFPNPLVAPPILLDGNGNILPDPESQPAR